MPREDSKKLLKPVFESEKVWFSRFVRDFCHGNENHNLVKEKPIPMKWSRYYLDNISFDAEEGDLNGKKWVDESIQVMGGSEGLTTLQEIVLDADTSTALYQIDKLIDLDEEDEQSEDEISSQNEQKTSTVANKLYPGNPPIWEREKSILHFSILTGQLSLVEALLTKTPFCLAVNQKDVITGFSPCHFASFVQNREILWKLITHGASIDYKDNYGASCIDYLRLLGKLPRFQFEPSYLQDQKLKVLVEGKVVSWNIPEFETQVNKWSEDNCKKFGLEFSKFSYSPFYSIDFDYIEELMFGALQVPEEKDMEFRRRYFPQVIQQNGDKNLILAFVNDQVGWGCYAAKPFKKGDYITNYYGKFVNKSKYKNRDYSMSCSVDGIILNALFQRNLGAFINHSSHSNAEAEVVFECGIDRPIITATRDIRIGEQICIDYGEDFFRKKKTSNTEKKNAHNDSSKKQAKPIDYSQASSDNHEYEDLLQNFEPGKMPGSLPNDIISLITTEWEANKEKIQPQKKMTDEEIIEQIRFT